VNSITISFQDFLNKAIVDYTQEANATAKHQRFGQWFYNDMILANPDLAEHIRGSKYDPFYLEQPTPEQLRYIELVWANPPKQPLVVI